MFGLFLFMLVTVLAFYAGYRLAEAWSRSARMAGVLACLSAGLLFFRLGYDTVAVVSLLPPSWLPFVAEWQAPLVALGAGIFLREITLPWWRRVLLSGLLVLVSVGPVGKVIFGKVPHSENLWNGMVCRQTHPATCSAAAAATLLQYHGIAAVEGELIMTCFTRKDGTSLGGLLRGLDMLARPQGWKVQVATVMLEDLKKKEFQPAILLVHLRPEVAAKEPRYENQWGWAIGQSHAVVLLGFTQEGQPIIGDPSVGREVWSSQGLAELWTGTAVSLEQTRAK
jgi:predicted double-glycine peptidase